MHFDAFWYQIQSSETFFTGSIVSSAGSSTTTATTTNRKTKRKLYRLVILQMKCVSGIFLLTFWDPHILKLCICRYQMNLFHSEPSKEWCLEIGQYYQENITWKAKMDIYWNFCYFPQAPLKQFEICLKSQYT